MDFLNSFFQNIKDKLTSPFFGTLSFILIIHHWEFWYTLFSFDKDCTRPEKVAILTLIAKKEFGGWNLFCDVITAIIVMLIGYGIVMSTRTLSLAIDFRFMPWITGKVISKNVVERVVHEEVVRERDEYSEKYEEQRKSVRTFSKDYDDQAEQIQEKNTYINLQQGQIAELQKANADLETNLSTQNANIRSLKEEKSKIQEDYKRVSATLQNESKRLEINEENVQNLLSVLIPNGSFTSGERLRIPTTIMKLADKIKIEGNWHALIIYLDFEKRGGSIGGEVITKMKSYGIAGNDDRGRITPLGKIFAAYLPFLGE